MTLKSVSDGKDEVDRRGAGVRSIGIHTNNMDST